MGNISSCYKSSKPETTKMDPCTPPIDNQSAKSNASYSAQADSGQPEDVSLSMDSPSTPAKKQTVSSPLLSVHRPGGSYDGNQK
ncbi:hypothetical protein DVH05_020959 [Phytophthora capsici]|nr:hypothetical protein DVH05_020959 [Phytophthora capsici]